MASTTIKIDTKLKEQLEKDAKENFRSISGQASFYIAVGMMVQKDMDWIKNTREAMSEEPNDKSN